MPPENQGITSAFASRKIAPLEVLTRPRGGHRSASDEQAEAHLRANQQTHQSGTGLPAFPSSRRARLFPFPEEPPSGRSQKSSCAHCRGRARSGIQGPGWRTRSTGRIRRSSSVRAPGPSARGPHACCTRSRRTPLPRVAAKGQGASQPGPRAERPHPASRDWQSHKDVACLGKTRSPQLSQAAHGILQAASGSTGQTACPR